VENFGGDLELKRLDLTWSGQVDLVDLTVATLRSTCTHIRYSKLLPWSAENIYQLCILISRCVFFAVT